ncbi:MAG: DnaD domain protein [Bacilli bacterium]|nr:DnaD domain protein [Bacilli bacterium]
MARDNVVLEYIGENDIAEIYSNCIIGSVELETIFRLYQPLIGYMACSLYFTLLNYIDYKEEIQHKFFFDIMHISAGNFLYARRSLEACGLLKTYQKKFKNVKKYKYILFAPKKIMDFFDNALFYGQLIKNIGKKNALKIIEYYKNNIVLDNFNDISADFNDIFSPDAKDLDIKLEGILKDNKSVSEGTGFQFDIFFKKLRDSNINEHSLTSSECKKIEETATLYGLNADIMGDIVLLIYDENKKKGNRINITMLAKKSREKAKYFVIENSIMQREKNPVIKISKKTMSIKEISLMDKISPREYLQLKQSGIPVTESDLNYIFYLRNTLKLSNSVINALLWISFKKFDNSINRRYIDTIAGAIIREKITNAGDVIEYVARDIKPKPLFSNQDNNDSNNNNGYEGWSEEDEHEKDKLLKELKKLMKY